MSDVQNTEIIRLTNEDINEAYTRLQQQQQIYEENREYVKGANPDILKKVRRKDPDNRIPIPLAKAAVIDMTGYSGSDISTHYISINEEDKTDELRAYQDLLRIFESYNEDDVLTSELYKSAISHIEVYLLMWVSDELDLPDGVMTPEYAVVNTDKMVLIWDDNLKPNIIAACYFVKEGDTLNCQVYYPYLSEAWSSDSGGGTWSRKEDKDTQYPYSKVPVIRFRMATDGGPMFQAEKPLIDSHDEVVSKSQNEIDRFNALILKFPGKVDADFMEKFETLKAIDDLDQYDREPGYIEKDLTGVTEYTNRHMDRLERLFHKCIHVVDFNNIAAQGGDESGAARAFKLLGMEFLASDIEKVFKKGFYNRTEFFNDIIDASTLKIPYEEYTTVVEMKRNLPVDELNKTNIAIALKGLGVRDETILRILPNTLIKDVEKEVEAMEKAETERQDAFIKALEEGSNNQNDQEDDTI